MKPIVAGASFALIMIPIAAGAADMVLTDAYRLRAPTGQVMAHPLAARRVIVEQRVPVTAPTRVIEHRVIEGPGYRTRTTRVTETAPAYGVGVHASAPRPPRDIPFASARAIGHPAVVRPLGPQHSLQEAVAFDDDEDEFD